MTTWSIPQYGFQLHKCKIVAPTCTQPFHSQLQNASRCEWKRPTISCNSDIFEWVCISIPYIGKRLTLLLNRWMLMVSQAFDSILIGEHIPHNWCWWMENPKKFNFMLNIEIFLTFHIWMFETYLSATRVCFTITLNVESFFALDNFTFFNISRNFSSSYFTIFGRIDATSSASVIATSMAT